MQHVTSPLFLNVTRYMSFDITCYIIIDKVSGDLVGAIVKSPLSGWSSSKIISDDHRKNSKVLTLILIYLLNNLI